MTSRPIDLSEASQVSEVLLAEKDRVVVIRFEHGRNAMSTTMDETLFKIAPEVKNFAVVYLVDITKVPDFNKMYQLYDPCTVMFFFRNKQIMVDLGSGNNKKINWAVTDGQELIDIIETVYRGARNGLNTVKTENNYSRSFKYSEGGPEIKWRRPIPLWQHLKILADHAYAEDALLLYEITNQSTSSTRWTVPENPEEFEVFHQLGNFYDKTKRYAQANAIFKTIIQTFPNKTPFSRPSLSFPKGNEEDEVVETPREIEDRDFTWMCLYRTLQKTNKLKEAYEALKHVRGKTYTPQKLSEMKRVKRQLKKEEPLSTAVPEQCDNELPDENSARICSSSLGPVMSVLLKGKGDATLVKRFSDQFLGTERSDVFWWLKSMESVGKQHIYDAIACLEKMSHHNPRVLTAMARLNYRIGKRDEARRLLRTAHANDPLWIDGMDLLAFLCIGDIAQYETLIEELATTLNTEWPHRVETYVVNGFMVHQMDLDMARAFANRAMKCAAPRSDQYVFAVHLKAYCLRTLEVKAEGEANADKYRQETLRFLEECFQSMPTSNDLCRLIIDNFLEKKETHCLAKSFATKFLHNSPKNVYAKLLIIHVLINDENLDSNNANQETKELYQLLEEVIDEHPHILAAYCFLLSEYARLKNNEKCKKILDKLTAARHLISPVETHKFHRMKADYMLNFRQVIPAYEHLMAAIATGAVVDQAQMAVYELEFASSKAITHDYKNLDFLDPILPRQPTSSSVGRNETDSNAFKEIVRDPENGQHWSDDDLV
ncbi:hypothetical protein GCK72_016193 [Caenorhabditis remanei]|uniref:Uncharacterized protein n=1 Tax=Caenorhabditis remanei TaxID=31234 RepID=A0A6A5GYS4_CAERE|nr:hypothetical protein GCK72_016193 [Caenorhabditis remanei]KAF1759726.1 hypothetical protein GCK72_016193 [Caenorhabditis remanei]